MKYDFDIQINRYDTGSLKWDVSEDELPLWVADMDFDTAPSIKEAIINRAGQGAYGYNVVTDEWYDSYNHWWSRRHGITLEKDNLIFCTGVVPALSSTVRKLTTPNENVVILTPVYNIFFNSIINNGARVLECPLRYDSQTRDKSSYSIDWEALESALADPQTTLLIFCNPHNPVGKIWSGDELIRVGELCAKYGVTVFSDEIHCDVTAPGKGYIPFAAASETCRNISITAISPSKAFSIPGLQTAAVYVPNPFLKHKIYRCLNTDEVAEPGTFAVPATIAAFEKSEDWLEELRVYLWDNRTYAEEFMKSHCPQLKVVPAEATYLMWVNISATGMDGTEFAEKLRKETGLYICEGNEYGKTGEDFVRINLACPRAVLREAMSRLQDFLSK